MSDIVKQEPKLVREADYELSTPLDGTSYAVRENLQDILFREMVGPSKGEHELIDVSPKSKYILGRIAPTRIHDADDGKTELPYLDAVESDDEDDNGSYDVETDEGESNDSPQRRGLLIPSSMGLRFQIPCSLAQFTVHCSWGVYGSEKTDEVDGGNQPVRVFRRNPVEVPVRVRVAELTRGRTTSLPVKDSVVLRIDLYDDAALDRYLVEIALCNDAETEMKIPVSKWMFQTALNVDADGEPVFLPVHDWNEDTSFVDDTDTEVRRLHLQYRNRLEYAVGRTCSADWTESTDVPRRAVSVRTTWMPTADIPQTSAQTVPGAELDMSVLGEADADAVRDGLRPIVDGYARWLDAQDANVAGLPEHLRETASEAVAEARQVLRQLEDGLEFLAGDEEALRCFRFMNRVMCAQRVHSQIAALRAANPSLTMAEAEGRVLEGAYPHHWRVFQIAFILMQVHALTNPSLKVRSDRTLSKAQLLFFPTGGGKTEAYLGLAAYAFAIRRRQGIIDSPDGPLDGNDGVTVLMRYTLRLLTSQQFQRASTLVCAAELERRKHPELWGDVPFRIGLWVGTSVTPKRVKEAARDIQQSYERGSGRAPDVLQIASCPWCGASLGAGDVKADLTLSRVFVRCSDVSGVCPFSSGEGIPVLTTDEEIYRLVPAFVIATVDKFARLAREGMAASLFGYVGRKCDRHGYVPRLDIERRSDYEECTVKDDSGHPASKDGHPAARVHPTDRLRPPDLIIQDELHLITGSLGTTVGLFEAGIDVMATWRDTQGRTVRPMIVASSATVRNAADQIKKLYARGVTMFPPQVLDASDTFFSKEQEVDEEHPGRRYLGISTTGVRLSNAEIQTAENLLKGAQLLMDRPGGGNATDPYMTMVGYFSTTRELAGMARFMQDDISTHVRQGRRGSDLPRRFGAFGKELRMGELTSRIASSDIVHTLNAMANRFDKQFDSTAAWSRDIELRKKKLQVKCRPVDETPFDAVLATSMLQVGVDVPRLGLMMIVGQPKNTAEYIQASSRVGRDPARPGLVVTLGNWARPRDLAHFEQFRAYHDSFYARVEPLSVTPFSETNLDRGVEGLLVSVARVLQGHEQDGLSPERNAGQIDAQLDSLETMLDALRERILRAGGEDGLRYAEARLGNRLDAWEQRQRQAQGQGKMLTYDEDKIKDRDQYIGLICSAEEVGNRSVLDSDERFVIANSMREVQPEINILVSPAPERLGYTEPDAPQWKPQDTDASKQEGSNNE